MTAEFGSRERLSNAILGWFLGWAGGGLIAAAMIAVLSGSDVHWVANVLAVAFAAVGFGFPVVKGATAAGASHPKLEGLVWTIGFSVAAMMLVGYYVDSTGLAQPGDLNINTTETMRQRDEYFRTAHYPPEVVFATWVVVLTAGTCGLVSGVVNTGRTVARAWRPIVFAATVAAGIVAALVVAILVLSIAVHVIPAGLGSPMLLLGPFAAFAIGGMGGGSVAGLVIEPMRRVLLRRG